MLTLVVAIGVERMGLFHTRDWRSSPGLQSLQSVAVIAILWHEEDTGPGQQCAS